MGRNTPLSLRCTAREICSAWWVTPSEAAPRWNVPNIGNSRRRKTHAPSSALVEGHLPSRFCAPRDWVPSTWPKSWEDHNSLAEGLEIDAFELRQQMVERTFVHDGLTCSRVPVRRSASRPATSRVQGARRTATTRNCFMFQKVNAENRKDERRPASCQMQSSITGRVQRENLRLQKRWVSAQQRASTGSLPSFISCAPMRLIAGCAKIKPARGWDRLRNFALIEQAREYNPTGLTELRRQARVSRAACLA